MALHRLKQNENNIESEWIWILKICARRAKMCSTTRTQKRAISFIKYFVRLPIRLRTAPSFFDPSRTWRLEVRWRVLGRGILNGEKHTFTRVLDNVSVFSNFLEPTFPQHDCSPRSRLSFCVRIVFRNFRLTSAWVRSWSWEANPSCALPVPAEV